MTSIEQYVTEVEYSAYGVHSVLNRILVADGREPIRPQMMYNYLRNGLLVKGEKIFGETLRKVTTTETVAFLTRYCERNKIQVGEPTNPDQMELDLESVTD
jgi:hypothetical protein